MEIIVGKRKPIMYATQQDSYRQFQNKDFVLDIKMTWDIKI